MHGWIGDDARPFVSLSFACLELGFDQGDYPGFRSKQWYNSGQNQAQRDKGDVDDDTLDWLG